MGYEPKKNNDIKAQSHTTMFVAVDCAFCYPIWGFKIHIRFGRNSYRYITYMIDYPQ